MGSRISAADCLLTACLPFYYSPALNKFWLKLKVRSDLCCYDLCSPPPAHTGLCSSHLQCGFCQGTRARICIVIVWRKRKWIPAAAAVQSKEATTAAAARSAWLSHTLHKRASASERSSGRS